MGSRPRMTWMDTVRGFAIGLVILVHAATILVRFGYGTSPGWLVAFNEMFAPARMPALMFLSGMLLTASLRKGLRAYATGKLRKVAWPYVVWTVLFALLFPFAGSLLTLDFWATSYLWFLLYILVFYAIGPLTRWVPTWVLVVIPWVVAAAVDGQFNRRFFFLMGFFFLGKAVADHRHGFDRALASRWAWAALPAAVAFGVSYALVDPPRYSGLLAPVSVVYIVAAVKVAHWIGDRRWAKTVQFVGRNSLIFYVTHFPIITGVVLLGAALRAPTVLLIIGGFAAAVSGGFVAVWLARRTWARYLFELPGHTASRRTIPAG